MEHHRLTKYELTDSVKPFLKMWLCASIFMRDHLYKIQLRSVPNSHILMKSQMEWHAFTRR